MLLPLLLFPLLFFTSTLATTNPNNNNNKNDLLYPRASAFVAQMQSDIDTISDSIQRVTNSLQANEIASVPQDLHFLNGDLQVATKDVVKGAFSRDLEALAITFYVEKVMEPKVDEMIGALKAKRGMIVKRGRKAGVRRELQGLVGRTDELGRALLGKTPDERKPEARVVMGRIVRKLRDAAALFR